MNQGLHANSWGCPISHICHFGQRHFLVSPSPWLQDEHSIACAARQFSLPRRTVGASKKTTWRAAFAGKPTAPSANDILLRNSCCVFLRWPVSAALNFSPSLQRIVQLYETQTSYERICGLSDKVRSAPHRRPYKSL